MARAARARRLACPTRRDDHSRAEPYRQSQTMVGCLGGAHGAAMVATPAVAAPAPAPRRPAQPPRRRGRTRRCCPPPPVYTQRRRASGRAEPSRHGARSGTLQRRIHRRQAWRGGHAEKVAVPAASVCRVSSAFHPRIRRTAAGRPAGARPSHPPIMGHPPPEQARCRQSPDAAGRPPYGRALPRRPSPTAARWLAALCRLSAASRPPCAGWSACRLPKGRQTAVGVPRWPPPRPVPPLPLPPPRPTPPPPRHHVRAPTAILAAAGDRRPAGDRP